MTDASPDPAPETLTVVLERDLPHPPAKVWRALTTPEQIEAWLMKTDFRPEIGHRFTLSADWGVVSCEVMTVEPERALAYRWRSSGLDSIVRWTLTPSAAGTHLRVEQSGFRPDARPAYLGARAGWPRFLSALEALLARVA